MLRLMSVAHNSSMNCSVIIMSRKNPELEQSLSLIGIPYKAIREWEFMELYHWFKRQMPDVVYFFGRIRTIIWSLVANIADINVIIGAERSAADQLIDQFGRFIDQFFLDAYICNSKVAERRLLRLTGLTQKPITVIYNGINDSKKLNKIIGQEKVFPLVCIANIRHLKGQLVLLQAVRNLQLDFADLRVLLIGKDQTNGQFFDKASNLGLSETFNWVGYTEDVYEYLAKADIFVLPSLVREGTPTSILEAMLAKVPVIASDVGGVRELIRNKETGILVPPGDVDSLTQEIRKLLTSPALRHIIGENSHKYVLTYHTLERMEQEHLTVFKWLGNKSKSCLTQSR